ncbi:3-oxoacyl-[acyl-carrier-protein] synthase 2 [Serratia fonticola]|uniref:3-oxoacyl-[acyl-carrier-protein] synthase 2 n=1 Tax=Serratia fonticola TaxID=47917 RepID=A0A4U9V0S4_SERFO|nr:3-oxoacyl-[acyl-carrier-protein] synthase 2 [Serratia fonticola]
MVNLAAGHVSIKHQFKGPIGAPVTACAAGVQAIGDAVRMIRNDEADIALCGGTEAAIDTVSLGALPLPEPCQPRLRMPQPKRHARLTAPATAL